MNENQTSNIAEPVNPYSLVSKQEPVTEPVNPSQPLAVDQQQPVATPQPGSAEYMNSEAANPPPVEQHPLTPHLENLVNSQHDAKALLNYEGPDHLKTIATQRAGENLTNDMEKQKAISNIQQMQPTDLANALKEKTTGGSWTKAIIYGILGMENSAQAEAAKLGIGKHTTVLGPDNKPYLIKVSANGTPLEGFDAETGKKLSAEQLVSAASGSTVGKGNKYSGGSKIYTIPKGEADAGHEYTSRFNQASGRFENIITTGPNANKLYSGAPGLEKRVETAEEINKNKTETQTQANKDRIDYRLNQNLKYAGPMAYTKAGAAYVGRYNAENNTNLGYNREGVLVDHNNNSQPVQQNNNGTINAVEKVENKPTPSSTPAAPLPPGMPIGTPISGAPAINLKQPQQPTETNVPGQPPAYNPQLSPAQNKEMQKNWTAENKKILTDFSPGGSAGKQLIAINTATNHIMDDFEPMVKKLQNGQFPTANEIKQKFTSWTGGSDYTNINLIGHAMADEISKTLTTGGPGALADRQAMEAKFYSAQSPKQLMDAVESAKRLMAGKTETLSNQYARTGRTDFYKNLAPDPRVKAEVDKIQSERPTRSKW